MSICTEVTCVLNHYQYKNNMSNNCVFSIYCSRDLFGGEEVEVVPHHSSSNKVNQGTIEIIVNMTTVIIKSHAKFDIFPKPIINDTDPLIQFHTTTTETISLQQSREASHLTTLKEKKTEMTGWRTLAIRPAYYERVPQMR